MSADLFAEFSTDSNTNQAHQSNATVNPQPVSTFSFFDDLNSQAPATTVPQRKPPAFTQSFGHGSSLPAQALTEDDTDDWGDFEGATSAADLDKSWTKAPIVKAKKPTDSRVLFDAEEDLEDEDEFGDFEDSQSKHVTPAPAAPLRSSSAIVDLLGDLDVSQAKPFVPSEKSKEVSKPSSKAKSTTKKDTVGRPNIASHPKQPRPAPASTPQVADDSWDTFDDWEASIRIAATNKLEATKITPNPTSSASAPILSLAIDDVQPGEQPPTNVPPPGILLSLFPSFFADAQEKLFKPMAAQTLPMRNKLLAEPGTIAYLQGYLMLASVAAHIIAGRKLRWKRDQHLSQGMRIGPASSRATSGMKLTGIDKGENLKEEREALDVVRLWKNQIGRLRHVISGVNQIKAGTLGAAPDLQEMMPVRTLKQSEGGVPARQPCMMCGLKRDERVGAADLMVEDSFGEWWVEQVNMHRGCRNFWNEHKDKLRQR
ncbi:hypothetical protein EJ07DRAFT_113992 [Lizonia empirigonia]|nr:hypothetical protein EJ07DRAFT_113992 [Lizonia empirigonia]